VEIFVGSLGVFLAVLMPHLKSRFTLLICNFCIVCCYLGLWIVHGSQYAATSYALVALTIILQLFLGESTHFKMKCMRAIVGVVSSLVALVMLYQIPVDLILFMGVCLYRYAEVGVNKSHVRKYYLLGSVFYGLHALLLGNMFAFYMDAIIIISSFINFSWEQNKIIFQRFVKTFSRAG